MNYDYDRADAAYAEYDYSRNYFIRIAEFQFFESGNMRAKEIKDAYEGTYTEYSELFPYAMVFDTDSLLINDREYHIYSSEENEAFVLRIASGNEAENLDEYPRVCDYVFLERVN